MPPPRSYVIDTNVIVAVVRGNDLGQYLDVSYGLVGRGVFVLSIVTVGELYALANKFGWGAKKRADLAARLAIYPVVNLDDRFVQAYAEIDAASDAAGYKMGKNDVWIAATARVLNMTVLTTDKDFDHLHPTWIDREWVDPQSKLSP